MNMTDFYRNKKVLVTGHTGFKGAWISYLLLMLGADVTGYALNPPTEPSLFQLLKLENKMTSIMGDVRDREKMNAVFCKTRPDIVIHMAAQPLVRESYKEPAYTYEVNVMGTVNVMECVRLTDSVRSVVNVTTDKVYKNREEKYGYKEEDELNGYDPYSSSKSCSEFVTAAYNSSFLKASGKAVSTVRAGNAIGGGDFAADRIIPDCVRAAAQGRDIIVRNPRSVRPYEHVLEPVWVYLQLAKAQYEKIELAGSYNVGPDEKDCLTTEELVSLFCRTWEKYSGRRPGWQEKTEEGLHEAGCLQLNCTRLKETLGWKPVWNIGNAMDKLVEWYTWWLSGRDILPCMEKQVLTFMKEKNACDV